MANRFGIPNDVEQRLRSRHPVCAYCRREMVTHARESGCPKDKATIEHLNRNGPFYWLEGLREDELVICCGSCNSSRGRKLLLDWFQSSYCRAEGIGVGTVAPEVRRYLDTEDSRA